MKNKKLLYVLIPAVLLVWGIVGYKIYSKYADDNNSNELVEAVPQLSQSKIQSEAFHLLANYKDPFLGNKIGQTELKSDDHNSLQRPDKPVQQVVPVQKNPIRWPNINVGGKVNDKALIVIGNRRLIMSEGQEELGVTLLKFAADSIKLKYSGEERSFPIPR